MCLLIVEEVSCEKWLVGVKELKFWYTGDSEEEALKKLTIRIKHLLSGKERVKPAQKELASNALSEVRARSERKKI